MSCLGPKRAANGTQGGNKNDIINTKRGEGVSRAHFDYVIMKKAMLISTSEIICHSFSQSKFPSLKKTRQKQSSKLQQKPLLKSTDK